jgi:Protein of unknown function (DUF2726)
MRAAKNYSRATNRKQPLPYRRRGPLLSRGERAFFYALQAALGRRYLIAIKVRAADLLDCSSSAWKAGYGHMIARHHLDFVLCEPRSTEVVVVIELDDRSHRRPKRQRRDAFLNNAFQAAQMPLLRIKAAVRYSVSVLREQIQRATDCNL